MIKNILYSYFAFSLLVFSFTARPAMAESLQGDDSACRWSNYGVASWYGPGFHGRLMANGRVYDQNVISVAHRSLPLGTIVKVTNLENGKFIIAPVWDRGPYIYRKGMYTREIDLSYAAAKALGSVDSGLAQVKIELIEETDKTQIANAVGFNNKEIARIMKEIDLE
jgi:rare lipoprotein A